MNALTAITRPEPGQPTTDLTPLRHFVSDLAILLGHTHDLDTILGTTSELLARLVKSNGWLPDAYAQPHPDRYQQYLLHCDSAQQFSVVSFVWGPGQSTPIHDHRVWGLVGMLRGAEDVEDYRHREPDGALIQVGPTRRLIAGEVEAIDPREGDIHRVSNAFPDRTSISIHVYGANIGAVERATYRPSGEERPFISGYANRTLPNIWDLSRNA